MTEDEFEIYMNKFYDLFDKKEQIGIEMDKMQPTIQNMMDRGYGDIIWDVITKRQRGQMVLQNN